MRSAEGKIKLYDSFSSESEFALVRARSARMVADGELLNLGLDPDIKYRFDVIYKSTTDGVEYVLSHLDHAYRGYLKLK